MKICRTDGSLIGKFESVEAAVKSGAHLFRANLSRANLSEANLSGADLFRARLSEANLSGANLKIKQIPQIKIAPEKGSFVAWKKLRNCRIAELLIPSDAERVNSTGRKIRVSYCRVVKIIGNKELYKSGVGLHDKNLVYKVGKIVRPDSYNPDFRLECSHGIHCFITKREAEEFRL